MTITKEQTVAECVADNYQTAVIFKDNNIDFCCGGKISIEDACKKNNIDEETLLQSLNELVQNKKQENPVEQYELDDLADYIVGKHHKYVRESIPQIEPFLDKVVDAHSQRHPELYKVRENFLKVKNELLAHMVKEERVLFPFIKEMVKAKKNGSKVAPPFFGTIRNPINMMEADHESAGNDFKEIRSITNALTPPSDACNTYRVTFSLLDEFESDLHRHIHLENNILFPKSIILESELLS